MVLDNLTITISLKKDNLTLSAASHLQHRVVQLCARFIHPVDPWIQEKWVVADAREENFHHKGSVVEEGNSRGLEVHREVGHVCLQLGKRLLTLTPHVVL